MGSCCWCRAVAGPALVDGGAGRAGDRDGTAIVGALLLLAAIHYLGRAGAPAVLRPRLTELLAFVPVAELAIMVAVVELVSEC